MKTKTLGNKVSVRLPEDLYQEFNQAIDIACASKSKVLRSLISGWLLEQREEVNV